MEWWPTKMCFSQWDCELEKLKQYTLKLIAVSLDFLSGLCNCIIYIDVVYSMCISWNFNIGAVC